MNRTEKEQSLYYNCRNSFTLGVAVNRSQLSSETAKDLISLHFNTITPENDFKPENLLVRVRSAENLSEYNESACIDYSNIDRYMTFAAENGQKVRFHTLVWHNQTPRWFFTETYSTAASASFASAEVMKKRLENYIKNIMEYTNEKYPGMIYAWDVVNEAVADDGNSPGGLRTQSLWYELLGSGYIEFAYSCARKYASPGAKLFYNDYNAAEYSKSARICSLLGPLKEKGLVDGIGMQFHHAMTWPDTSTIKMAILDYAALGLEIQCTEFDLDTRANDATTLDKQAERYASLFSLLLDLDTSGAADITNVSFWGLTDADSWLTSFKGVPEYPLLFDAAYQPKPAYFRILDVMKNLGKVRKGTD
jgi:endo-1,4-beta-xylanase